MSINGNKINSYNYSNNLGIGDWGLGIGPNPQSPIPQFKLFHKLKLTNNFYNMLVNFLMYQLSFNNNYLN